MFDAFQLLIMSDAGTALFLVVYIGCLVTFYAINAVYVLAVPKPAVRTKRGAGSGPSPIQIAAKGAITRFAHWIASQNITPNQITLVGLVLVAFNCVLFVYHRNTFFFGTSLIVAYLFDTLDGVVARAQGKSTKFGGYLDAVVDRYQEVITYLVLGWVLDQWLVVFLVITGSMLTSYNKARAAIEIPVDNKGWPDLLGKPARLFFLCVALIGDANLPWLLTGTLWGLAIMTHFTALKRIARANFLIEEAETAGKSSREP